MGWTCDAQVFLNTACFNMDSYAFYSKYLWDMAMTQKEVGCVTEIIPAFGENTPACSAWGDAATIMPWNLYLFYGDKTILQQQYECMKQWADYEFSQDEKDGGSRLWKLKKGFGDWLAMDHDDPEEMFLGATDLTYISTAYYYYSTMIVAQTARILGNQADYDRYFTRACEIKDAFTKEYVTASGRLAINTQTAYILALYMGLLPDNAVEQNADALEAKLLSNNGYLNTGFLGTAYICQVLSAAGKDGAAYRLLFNEGTPSWLYGVNLGATTVWERWNSLNPDGSISSEGMNSFNHYAYGSVMEWMYRYMAGINPAAESPGFKKAVLTPRPNFRLKSVEASLNSPAGIYTVGWHMETDKTIRLRVQVPFDCEARLILPFSNGREELLRAGSYEFHYKAIKPLGEPPEIDGPFNRLKECIPVRPLLDKYFAGWQNIPRFHGQDSLARLCEIPYLHLNIDNIDLLKKDVEKLYS